MRIDINRLGKLAGLGSVKSKSLNEGVYHEGSHDEGYTHEGGDFEIVNEEEEEEEKKSDEASAIHGLEPLDEDDDQVYEIDEADLVMELRRAKRIMEQRKRKAALNEAKRRQRKEKIVEAQIKRVIDQEVKAVLQDLNLNSDWIYGNNKPRNSRHGYSHQGSFLKGLGFK